MRRLTVVLIAIALVGCKDAKTPIETDIDQTIEITKLKLEIEKLKSNVNECRSERDNIKIKYHTDSLLTWSMQTVKKEWDKLEISKHPYGDTLSPYEICDYLNNKTHDELKSHGHIMGLSDEYSPDMINGCSLVLTGAWQ